MRLYKSLVGLVTCTLIAGAATVVLAQPGPGGPGGPRMGMGMRRGGMSRMLPRILGRPLTAGESAAIQKADAVREARMKPIEDAYKLSVARALHMTPAQLDAKRMAYMKANGFGGRGGPGAAPPR